MVKIRVKNVSRQNPLAIMLDTKGPDGIFESRNLAPGEICDLTKLQNRSHQVKKLKTRGYLREIPVSQPGPEKLEEEVTEEESEGTSE